MRLSPHPCRRRPKALVRHQAQDVLLPFQGAVCPVMITPQRPVHSRYTAMPHVRPSDKMAMSGAGFPGNSGPLRHRMGDECVPRTSPRPDHTTTLTGRAEPRKALLLATIRLRAKANRPLPTQTPFPPGPDWARADCRSSPRPQKRPLPKPPAQCCTCWCSGRDVLQRGSDHPSKGIPLDHRHPRLCRHYRSDP